MMLAELTLLFECVGSPGHHMQASYCLVFATISQCYKPEQLIVSSSCFNYEQSFCYVQWEKFQWLLS